MFESELQDIQRDKSGQLIPFKQGKEAEYWEFLLMMGFGNISATKNLFDKLRGEIGDDDWRRPLLLLGEARYSQISGRDYTSFIQLEEASKIIFPLSYNLNENFQSELMSIYLFTSANLLDKIGQRTNIVSLLETGSRLTLISSFKLALNYKITVKKVELYSYLIKKLISIVTELREKNLWVLACLGYRQIGIFLRQRNDYPQAHHYFDLALRLAEEMNLRVSRNQIINAKAYSHFYAGNLEESEALFAQIIPDGELDPILPILNENLALLAKARKNMDLSMDHMKIALSVSSQLDSVSHTPGECLYLGQLYEKQLGDLDQAEHYYRLGYEHAMRYAGAGITLTGDRKEVVETYIQFISHNKHSTKAQKAEAEKDGFAFSQGKSWKEIKDIFQHQLICFHGAELRSSKLLAAKLDLPPSTLYSLQDRLKARGFELPEKKQSNTDEHHDLYDFITEHQALSWEAIHLIFEREIMHYLYERYGYNKHRMAKILDLSYPSIIKKTRELTQVHEHFFPN